MNFSRENFKTLGKCYFFSLALNGLVLLTFAFLTVLLFKEKSNPDYKTIIDFLINHEDKVFFISLCIISYFCFCLLLNAVAGLLFYYDKMKEFQTPIVIVNLLCLPFGTIISIFTLYVLHTLRKSTASKNG